MHTRTCALAHTPLPVAQVAAELVLFTYSQLLATSCQLLHCVSVAGSSGTRLFLSGDVQCYNGVQVTCVQSPPAARCFGLHDCMRPCLTVSVRAFRLRSFWCWWGC